MPELPLILLGIPRVVPRIVRIRATAGGQVFLNPTGLPGGLFGFSLRVAQKTERSAGEAGRIDLQLRLLEREEMKSKPTWKTLGNTEGDTVHNLLVALGEPKLTLLVIS